VVGTGNIEYNAFPVSARARTACSAVSMQRASRGGSKMRALALACGGNGGDFPPVANIVFGLRRRGHTVRFFCDPPVARALAPTGIEVSVLPESLSWQSYLRSWRRKVLDDPSTKAAPFPLPRWSLDCTPHALSAASQFEPDVILSSLFCIELAARTSYSTSVPWCFVNPSFYFGRESLRPVENDYSSHVIPLRTEYWSPLVETADLVLHATDVEFDFRPPDLPLHHRYVGPQCWEPHGITPYYLDEPGNPWILVTLSLAPQPGDMRLVDVAIQAVASRPLRALVTLSSKRPHRYIDSTPNNVRVAKYVPHSEVLKRSVLLLSHAGHGSVIKALYFGVPMVLVPLGRDQPGVAARAERLGVARTVDPEEIDAETLGAAIDEVLNDVRYRDRARLVSERLQSTDWTALACCSIEEHIAGTDLPFIR
jgi:UDP:flavonoid glycosyltransferase YjiC (YdhE family)